MAGSMQRDLNSTPSSATNAEDLYPDGRFLLRDGDAGRVVTLEARIHMARGMCAFIGVQSVRYWFEQAALAASFRNHCVLVRIDSRDIKRACAFLKENQLPLGFLVPEARVTNGPVLSYEQLKLLAYADRIRGRKHAGGTSPSLRLYMAGYGSENSGD